jgi:colanic acid/amylovoran biosynthesis glycosyltransferase
MVPNNVRMLEKDKIRKVLEKGDAFFVNTSFARDQLLGHGCPADRIRTIPQGTRVGDFPFRLRRIKSGEPLILLSVGRLSVEKGFHVAIRAIARLKKSFPNIEYRIIGSGLEEQRLKDLIKSHAVQDCVKLCGSASTEQLREHYEKASIFVLPSIDLRDGTHTETQGVVLQEAQASGIPVIASRTGGIPEVIKDRITGFLFDEEDDEELAHLAETLITDEKIYRSISVQARKDVEENYSIDVIRERLIAAYNSIIDA